MAHRLSLIIISIFFVLNNAYSANNALLENERNSISIFQNVADSVVNVSNMQKARSFSNFNGAEVESGAGSGLVWSKDGYIVTNFHVVDGGDSFLITFKDSKKQFRAKFIGADPKKDIAVLKLLETPTLLVPIVPGDSKNLLVGQKALAIGNPLGFDHSLSTGSISALGRSIKGYGEVTINGMIQTDAAINPGNSGGALLDSQGKLIGINTMIFNAGGASASAGLGFAIPVDSVKIVVTQIIQFGKVIRPGLGIALLDDYNASRFGLKTGVMLKYLDPKGPAAKAGLKGITRSKFGEFFAGDIIIQVEGIEIKNYDDLFSVIDKYKIGDTVKIKYLRDNNEKSISLKLIQI
jgi:S1-C subfamily serine protease